MSRQGQLNLGYGDQSTAAEATIRNADLKPGHKNFLADLYRLTKSVAEAPEEYPNFSSDGIWLTASQAELAIHCGKSKDRIGVYVRDCRAKCFLSTRAKGRGLSYRVEAEFIFEHPDGIRPPAADTKKPKSEPPPRSIPDVPNVVESGRRQALAELVDTLRTAALLMTVVICGPPKRRWSVGTTSLTVGDCRQPLLFEPQPPSFSAPNDVGQSTTNVISAPTAVETASTNGVTAATNAETAVEPSLPTSRSPSPPSASNPACIESIHSNHENHSEPDLKRTIPKHAEDAVLENGKMVVDKLYLGRSLERKDLRDLKFLVDQAFQVLVRKGLAKDSEGDLQTFVAFSQEIYRTWDDKDESGKRKMEYPARVFISELKTSRWRSRKVPNRDDECARKALAKLARERRGQETAQNYEYAGAM